jgi:hypothetical protein
MNDVTNVTRFPTSYIFCCPEPGQGQSSPIQQFKEYFFFLFFVPWWVKKPATKLSLVFSGGCGIVPE